MPDTGRAQVLQPDGSVAAATIDEARRLLGRAQPVVVEVRVGDPAPERGDLADALGLKPADPADLGWLGEARPPARFEISSPLGMAVAPAVVGERVTMVQVVAVDDDLVVVHRGSGSILSRIDASGLLTAATGADRLVGLLDALIATFHDVVDQIVLDAENLEDDMLDRRDRRQLDRLTAQRRHLMRLRRGFAPYADAVRMASERSAPGPAAASPHDRLVAAHVRAVGGVAETIRSAQDTVGHAFDVYSSLVATEQNAVINRLTVVATVFLPLTYITGFFGMNFRYLSDRITTPGAFWVWGIGFQVLALAASVYLMWRRGDWRLLTTEAAPNPRRRRHVITR